MAATEETEQAAEETGSKSEGMGIVRGVVGEHIKATGVLDLRGVTPEELQKLKSVEATGVILIDNGQRAALSHVKMNAVGTMVEIAEGEQVLFQPNLDITRATLEGMAAGQRLTVVGVVFFAPDAPAALVAEKFAFLRLVGVMVAPQSVIGALFGRLEHTGVTVTLEEGDGPLRRQTGNTTLTPGLLAHYDDRTAYLNMGRTEIAADVPMELLSQKIGRWYNLGLTVAPKPLLELLEARCPNNAGAFQTPDGEKKSDGE